MKVFIILILLAFNACKQESSPEGRSKIRDKKLEQEIIQLKNQNDAILDSIAEINRTLLLLKKQN